MRTDTQSVTIAATPERVLDFVADPESLPKWAIGFAQSVRRTDEGQWIVTSPQGDVGIRVDVDRERGTVDYVMSPAPGVELTAFSRVLPNDSGAEFVFTQFQPAGMPDAVFEGQVQSLGHEFNVLRSLLEVACAAS